MLLQDSDLGKKREQANIIIACSRKEFIQILLFVTCSLYKFWVSS
jgi:hypothetical protein